MTAQPTINTNQHRQIQHVIFLNISSSMHTDDSPQMSSYSPQMVAMKWQSSPLMKMVRVLRVRQTSPHGMTLLMRQSRIPSMQRTERRAVPPQTIIDPQQMKCRQLRLSGSVHSLFPQSSIVTQATMNTPRLFIWAGMLKGSISCCTGPWCFGIRFVQLLQISSDYQLQFMQPVRFTYRQPQQLLRKVTSNDHIIKSTNILRINYCEPYRFTAQPIEMGLINEENGQEGDMSLRSSLRLSRASKKLSVVSREFKDSQKSQERSILLNSYDEDNLPIHQTDSLLMNSEGKAAALPIQPEHINSQPIIDQVPCNFFNCEEPKQKAYTPEPSVDSQSSRTSNGTDRKQTTQQLENRTMVMTKREPSTNFQANLCSFCKEEVLPSSDSICKQKRTRRTKLVYEQEETFDDADIPEAVAKNWRRLQQSQANAQGLTIQIAPFVLPGMS